MNRALVEIVDSKSSALFSLSVTSCFASDATTVNYSCRKGLSQLSSLRSPYLELDLLDADFLPSLFVVVEPVAFGEIDAVELGAGLYALGIPVALLLVNMVQYDKGLRKDVTRSRAHEDQWLTSGLNSTNSRPLQSIVMIFCNFGGSC